MGKIEEHLYLELGMKNGWIKAKKENLKTFNPDVGLKDL